MKEFFGNVRQELNKITWPTDAEMKKYTAQVFVFMVVLSLFFFAIDGVVSAGMAAANSTPEFVPPIVEEVDYYDDYDYEFEANYNYDDYANDYDEEDAE